MSNTIYLIQHDNGEPYEDNYRSIVTAYATKEAAEQHVADWTAAHASSCHLHRKHGVTKYNEYASLDIIPIEVQAQYAPSDVDCDDLVSEADLVASYISLDSLLHTLDSQASQDSVTYSQRWLAEYEFSDWLAGRHNKEANYKQIGWFYSAHPNVGYAVFLYKCDSVAEPDNGYAGKYIAMRVVGVAEGQYEQHTLVGAGCAGAAGAYDTPEQAIAACEAEMGGGGCS